MGITVPSAHCTPYPAPRWEILWLNSSPLAPVPFASAPMAGACSVSRLAFVRKSHTWTTQTAMRPLASGLKLDKVNAAGRAFRRSPESCNVKAGVARSRLSLGHREAWGLGSP